MPPLWSLGNCLASVIYKNPHSSGA